MNKFKKLTILAMSVFLLTGCAKNLTDENTSEANYVWLPIRFDENNIPHIHYLREWKIED